MKQAVRLAIRACLIVGIGCSSAPTAVPNSAPCTGLLPPRLASPGRVALPSSYLSARLGSEVLEEVVIDRDGSVKQTRLLAAAVPLLAPYAQVSLEKSRYMPAAIDGHPVAVRASTTISVGLRPLPPSETGYDTVRVFVSGSSRESLWQLAGGVKRLTLVAHIGSEIAFGATIVAIASGGVEKTLLQIPASTIRPLEVRETVKTGRFFDGAGDYAIELRGGKVLASTTLTIAPGYETSIVNACEPLAGPEKTGPGR